MRNALRSGIAAAAAAVTLSCGGEDRSAAADRAATTVASLETRVTTSAAYETTPTLGADATGPLVVYTSRPSLANGGLGAGSIFYQRLAADGAPVGAPVLVSVAGGGTDDQLNDVSGSRIVYTAFDSTTTSSGRIFLFDLATGARWFIASAPSIREARIHGNKLAWIQGTNGNTVLMLYDLAFLGSGATARIIAGPIPFPSAPPATNAEIGERFLVWDETSGAQRDTYAYDLASGVEQLVAGAADVDERFPSTSGPWVVYEARPTSGSATRVEARNLDTGELRVVADGGTLNLGPTIDGDLVAWESRVNGNFDVFVHRLSKGDTFQVTSDPSDQRLNNVFGELVSYVDARSGNYDVYVSTLAFVDDPCAALGGDADADGVCDAEDNCIAAGNADQADADGDGLGDACDACPTDSLNDADADGVCDGADNCAAIANPSQADGDADGFGDACDPCPADPLNDPDGDGVCGVPEDPVGPACRDGGKPDVCGKCMSFTLSASRDTRPTRWSDGTACLCRKALVAIPARLEILEGSPARQWADLRLDTGEGEIRCRYRGSAAKGKKPVYAFAKCTGTARPLRAGDVVAIAGARLSIRNADPKAAATRVQVTLEEQKCGG